MSFNDIFKKNFLENFTTNISLSYVTITLILAIIFTFLVYFVYYFTCNKTIYSRKFNIAMSLMTIVTASVVMAIQSNVVVSLGMVGALSIVRYRTAIKEPIDLLFLFWAISNGIIIGSGLYSIAFILAIVISICLLAFEFFPKVKRPYLLVINASNISVEEKVNKIFQEEKIKYEIKSRNISKEKVDMIYMISGDIVELLSKINKLKEVYSTNLLMQDN